MSGVICEQRERFLCGTGCGRQKGATAGNSGRREGWRDGGMWMWVHFNQRDCLFAQTLMTASGAAREHTAPLFSVRQPPLVPASSPEDPSVSVLALVADAGCNCSSRPRLIILHSTQKDSFLCEERRARHHIQVQYAISQTAVTFSLEICLTFSISSATYLRPSANHARGMRVRPECLPLPHSAGLRLPE